MHASGVLIIVWADEALHQQQKARPPYETHEIKNIPDIHWGTNSPFCFYIRSAFCKHWSFPQKSPINISFIDCYLSAPLWSPWCLASLGLHAALQKVIPPSQGPSVGGFVGHYDPLTSITKLLITSQVINFCLSSLLLYRFTLIQRNLGLNPVVGWWDLMFCI